MKTYAQILAHSVAVAALAVGTPMFVWQAGVEPRLAGMIAGVLGMGVLGYQLISTWPETTLLAKVLVVVLIGSMMLSAIGQFQLRHDVSLVTVVTYPLIGHRVVCIAVGAYWRWLLRFDACQSTPRLTPEDAVGPHNHDLSA